MFVHVRIFFIVLLLSSGCQAPPSSESNSAKQTDNESEESGLWVVKVFKRAYRKAKDWAFGDDGFITNLYVKTGGDSSKSKPPGDCCCCCHKKPDSDSCPESDDKNCRQVCEKCLGCAGKTCEICAVAVCWCCCFKVAEPLGNGCINMLAACCVATDIIKYPFTKAGRGAIKKCCGCGSTES